MLPVWCGCRCPCGRAPTVSPSAIGVTGLVEESPELARDWREQVPEGNAKLQATQIASYVVGRRYDLKRAEAATGPAAATGTDQSGRTLSACGPFCPWVTSNSTFWPSLSSR